MHAKNLFILKLLKQLSTLLFFFLLACSATDDSQETTNDLNSIRIELQKIIDLEVSRNNVKGISVSIKLPGKGVWNGVAGISNASTAITEDTKFPIASLTKTAVAAIILQLLDEGQLSLSDPISNWLQTTANIDGSISVEQLLNHQSGIFNYVNHPDMPPPESISETKSWTPQEILEKLVDAPIFAPGSSFQYSNTNYIILGIIIESLTSTGLAAAMRDRLWTPLSLNSIYLSGESIPQPIADGWYFDSDGFLQNVAYLLDYKESQTLRWAAGGLLSTSKDFATWLEYLFNSDVFSQESLNKMTTFIPVSSGQWTGYGLGIQRYSFANGVQWGHSGLVTGHTALSTFQPKNGLIVSLHTNATQVNLFSIMEKLISKVNSFSPD